MRLLAALHLIALYGRIDWAKIQCGQNVQKLKKQPMRCERIGLGIIERLRMHLSDFIAMIWGWFLFMLAIFVAAGIVWGIGLTLTHFFPPIACYYVGNSPPPEPLIERN